MSRNCPLTEASSLVPWDAAGSGRAATATPQLALPDIIGHPRLEDARTAYLDHFLRLYDHNPFLARLLVESGRFAAYYIAAVLDAAQDPARRDTWLTIGHLKEKMALSGLASGRHLDDLVGRLCAVGFMELRRRGEDLRVRMLEPTEKFRVHDRDWLVTQFAPLTVLWPEHDYGPVMRRDPQFHRLLRAAAARFLPLTLRLFRGAGDIRLFLERAAGYAMLVALLRAATAEHHAPVSFTDVGERFGVSRTHVRDLLVAAEQASLVKLHAGGGRRVEILPRLWASFDRAMAAGMYLHGLIHGAAIRLQAAAAGSGADGQAESRSALPGLLLDADVLPLPAFAPSSA